MFHCCDLLLVLIQAERVGSTAEDGRPAERKGFAATTSSSKKIRKASISYIWNNADKIYG